jgi:cytochrome c556
MRFKFNKKYHCITAFLIAMFFVSVAHTDTTDIVDPVYEENLKFHAIYSEELRKIMTKISGHLYGAEKSKSEKIIHGENLEELIDTLNELMSAAINLRQALPGFELNNEEKTIFKAMVIQLQAEANKIKILAKADNYHDMEESYQRLNDTCAACHELFRF